MNDGEHPVEAGKVFGGTAFGPETLKVLGQAYDDAWSSIAGNFSEDSASAARMKLANIILAIATEDSRDVAALTAMALQLMARDHVG
jgi:hypothetical protein